MSSPPRAGSRAGSSTYAQAKDAHGHLALVRAERGEYDDHGQGLHQTGCGALDDPGEDESLHARAQASQQQQGAIQPPHSAVGLNANPSRNAHSAVLITTSTLHGA